MSLADRTPLKPTGAHGHNSNDVDTAFATEVDLAAAAVALGAADVHPWSAEETSLARFARNQKALSKGKVQLLRDLIQAGFDPLGEAFCSLRASEQRRESGAIYTPDSIVRAMVEWGRAQRTPARVIDPGTGSGRFLLRAGKTFPKAFLVGIDIDPLAGLLARANLATAGLADRSQIIVGDYRLMNEPAVSPTFYVGNPPYVRHHLISTAWKDWLFDEAAKLGHKASKLAGLHVHFILATARIAKRGDYGAFITAAEWLDVNYGSLVRSLALNELGAQSITVVEPTAQPFPNAAATAAITTFAPASKRVTVSFRRIDSLQNLGSLTTGRKVHRDRLSGEPRWSYLTHVSAKAPEGYVELGELCRVHRGQVTGANGVWIAGGHSEGLPDALLFRSVTKAREVFAAEGVLDDASRLRCVIDIPVDLEMLNADERRAVERFLKVAKRMGGSSGYVASHRKAWWAVGLRAPAPIISTYMARRPPAFALNKADARLINVAHGLYPVEPLSLLASETLVRFMQTSVSQRSGRTYAGGLTKFEPREMERLIVPGPAMLSTGEIA